MSLWLVAFAVGMKVGGVVLAFRGGPVAGWIAAIIFPDLVILFQMFWPTAGGVCPVLSGFETDENEIWLTIDDGPDPADTPRNLAFLREYRAKATFFLIGERAKKYPELVQAILREGHDVAHHTETHPAWSFWHAGPGRLGRELDLPLRFFESLSHRPRYFRPPVGLKNIFLAPALARRRMRCVAWTIRSYDSLCQSAEEVVNRVKPRLQPGAIILMHEGPELCPSVRQSALEAVLRAVTESGYRCVIPLPAQLRLKREIGLPPAHAEKCLV